jgi:hypothetical protein
MTTDEKLGAILAAVQTDPGGRGLARDPHDNLFTATKGDFESACRSIAKQKKPYVAVTTGFFIVNGEPPAFETDGPPGALFLVRALHALRIPAGVCGEQAVVEALGRCFPEAGLPKPIRQAWQVLNGQASGRSPLPGVFAKLPSGRAPVSHIVATERAGPARDGRQYTMRGRDITDRHMPVEEWFDWNAREFKPVTTIGIGDGGNEIGMGKIPHATVVKNIPNGDLIHCRVPTDYLIVAGVSNWGAYALAAGVYVLRGVKPPADLFDPDRERAILEVMVREGPLVDGVTGQQTATVDGLSWDEYARPLVRIREILES